MGILSKVMSLKHMFARLLRSRKRLDGGRGGSAHCYRAILPSTVKLLQLVAISGLCQGSWCPHTGAKYVYNFTLCTGPMAILCNSSLDLQRIGGSKAGDRGDVHGASWDFGIHNAGATMYSAVMSAGFEGIDRRGRGETERKKTVWIVPAVTTRVMEWSRTASAARRSAPSLAILQRQSGRLRKRLGGRPHRPTLLRAGRKSMPCLPQGCSAASALLQHQGETERNMEGGY